MNIIQTPNKVLQKPAEKVKHANSKIRAIVQEMKQTLRSSNIGVGLAAAQVGIALQIFVASDKMPDSKNKNKEQILVCVNPKITSLSKPAKGKKGEKKKLEGCLSIKNIWGSVQRSEKVTLRYLDEHGKKHSKTFTGFMATIVQHEIDHLNGILFTQRVLEQGGSLYREVSGKDHFEEIEV